MVDFSDTPPLPSTDWDVLISGTGIKQSLLAVALSRAGKSILQLDKNSYYGGSAAAFYSLSEADAWATRVNNGDEVGFTNAVVSNVGERGGSGRGYTLSLAPHLVYWHSGFLGMLREADLTDGFSWLAVGSWWVCLTEEEVAVPATGAGSAGIGLAEAGVKVAKLASAAGKKRAGWNKGRKKEPVAEAAVGGGGESAVEKKVTGEDGETTLRRVDNFREVPCTFEDVAWSKDLTDKDRGQLGEFLRFVMKYSDPTEQKCARIFEENRQTSLQTFLSTTFPIPPFITTSISSLTLFPSPPSAIPLEQALPRLAGHFTSLGKITDVRSSAALTIAYGGSAELCQVLSRAAAVAGGINVLGRGVTLLSSNNKESNGTRKLQAQLASGETIYTDWAIGEATDLAKEVKRASGKTTARGIYIIETDMSWLFERKYKDEGITPATAVAVIPSSQAAGGAPIYIIARSAATGECPRGQCLLHAFTESSYEDMNTAIDKLLRTCSPLSKILYSLQYTVDTLGREGVGEVEDGAVLLEPVTQDITLQDEVLEESLAIYERIMGTREGFMEVSEEIRRMKEEMEE
ncbi:FAD/NAD(P)-binding domain-containing protein [Choiromyces venosus 120613-1]|uniref:FAD/NAD(P)-binding domain-containing protein n=1 Tax=Choiromyces venosus 120613-1 TaxID=1336337 RepID=A0A3N4KFY3_9PEZI|nr:FAD/NAD(P)-binding domain-containing protein [Choiromyces venosus 120613-1]